MSRSQLLGSAVFVFLAFGSFSGWAFCFVTIGKGEVGVKSWFGELEDKVLEPGPNFVHPFKKVYRMNVQTQKDEEAATVATRKGLSVSMKATLLYHLRGDDAPKMAREVGEEYAARVVSPYFRNAVRDVAAEYEAEAFYTADRTAVERKVLERITKELGSRGIEVESVMLLDPTLPEMVKKSIEEKMSAEQDAIRMESVYKSREQAAMASKRTKELEAEAKVIEAKGIAEAQLIIKKDLDHNYLIYLWIEALKESAKHNNATIYIPTGLDGMPLFKGVK